MCVPLTNSHSEGWLGPPQLKTILKKKKKRYVDIYLSYAVFTRSYDTYVGILCSAVSLFRCYFPTIKDTNEGRLSEVEAESASAEHDRRREADAHPAGWR